VPRLAIARALKIAATHPSVVSLTHRDEADGSVTAEINVKTELPSAWRLTRESPSGVREIEPVSFSFTTDFPLAAPYISLRADFPRNHPHLVPGPIEEPPVPCIVDGRLNELFQLRGIEGLIDQLVDWLEHAALLSLNDPKQGWEPVRRDHIDDVLLIDGEKLRALMADPAGSRLLEIFYLEGRRREQPVFYVDHRCVDPINLTEAFFGPRRDQFGLQFLSAGMIVWPLAQPDGKAPVIDVYEPETVRTLGDLLERAAAYHCKSQFEGVLNQFFLRFDSEALPSVPVPIPVTITFLIPRPYDVIGTTSPIEICSYLIHVTRKKDLFELDRPIVRFCALRDQLSLAILRRASGETNDSPRLPWTLIGCGSVGSKIAIHLARRGRGPSRVMDHAPMSPHNFARHALVPDRGWTQFLRNKAENLAAALAGLEQLPDIERSDASSFFSSPEERAKVSSAEAGLLNTTASAALREYLAFLPWENRPQIGEVHLLGAGTVAYASFEGSAGNPNLSDLAVESFRLIARDPGLAKPVFSAEAEAVAIGQGCSALTFPMPDDRLSALTAGLSQTLIQRQFPQKSANGEIRLGLLGSDGVSQTWTHADIPPWTVVRESTEESCGVRLSARVDQMIRSEIAARPGVETGGVLIGRFALSANTFQVVDLLPAPPDSAHSTGQFVLGTQGLLPAIKEVIKVSGGSLYALGTWHNHLGDFGPSSLDLKTAGFLALRQFMPVLLLIARPNGYSCVIGEAFDTNDISQASPSSGTERCITNQVASGETIDGI